MYGDRIEREITTNLGMTDISAWVTNILSGMIVLNAFTTYPLVMQPVISAVQSSVETIPGTSKARVPICIALNLSVLLVSILLPSFQQIMSLLGSALSSIIAVTMPCLFHLRLVKDSSQSKRRVLYTLAVFGGFVGVTGTYATLFT